MAAFITPAYLPSIYYMSWLIRQEKIFFYTGGNYQKQTYRNRTRIYGANGMLNLTIPIAHSKKVTPQKDEEVQIFSQESWQKQHWKSITSAYRSSPYFEFYEDDLKPFFNKEYNYLMHLNSLLIKTLINLLGVEIQQEVMDSVQEKDRNMNALFIAKKITVPPLPPYKQVFDDKHGFLNNLSCIDLLFNLGPQSLDYLENIDPLKHQI